ncbi:hypothetical protein [uncultured Nitrospira sp.]|uniref:hypothetical protein n=1 Tax=uncultured Nitrospira sp. TaxID=157176 RepID=UPI0031402CBB
MPNPAIDRKEILVGAEEEELKIKIRKLVKEKFDGEFRKGFDHYDKIDGEDSKIGSSALEQLLTDAKVGNFLTRTLWVEGVMKVLDKDKDGAISWDEFASILEDSPQTKEETGKEPGDDTPDK